MNTFLIIYLGILLFEAILSTILKYAWQAEDKWDEPFYNYKTEQERNSISVRWVGFTDPFPLFYCTIYMTLIYLLLILCLLSTNCFLLPLLDLEVYLRLLGLHGPLQLHHPHLALRYCGDAEIPWVFFYRVGFGPLSWREWPEGSGQHIWPQRGAWPGIEVEETCTHTQAHTVHLAKIIICLWTMRHQPQINLFPIISFNLYVYVSNILSEELLKYPILYEHFFSIAQK